MRILLISVVISFLFVNTLVLGQQSDCDSLLKRVFEKKPAFKKDKIYYLNYGIKMMDRQSGRIQDNRIKMYADSLHRHILTDQVQIYTDTSTLITVVLGSKNIIIAKIDSAQKAGLKKLSGVGIEGSFTDLVKVETCKSITDNEHYTKELFVKPVKENPGVKNIKYYVDEKKQEVYRIQVFYGESNIYKYAEYTFYRSDFNYIEKKIDYPVTSIFFKKDGTLLPAYKGYTVTDNRKNKNTK